jgi:hypothetical protein
MSGYVDKVTSSSQAVHPELPSASAEVEAGMPHGARYRTSDGREFTLQHPVGARWREAWKRIVKANAVTPTAKK